MIYHWLCVLIEEFLVHFENFDEYLWIILQIRLIENTFHEFLTNIDKF